MRKPRILVVGSFVMDQIASTDIFPREGQTVLGRSFHKAPGGKGANQAVQAARLGADVTLVGKLGRDANGRELYETCKSSGIHMEHTLYDENTPSGCAVIILERTPRGESKNRIIVLPGSNMTLSPEEVSFLKSQIHTYDMVILQLEIPMEVNESVAEYAANAGVPVLLNCAPSAPLRDDFLRRVHILSPNEHEAFDLTGIAIGRQSGQPDRSSVAAATGALRARGVHSVLLTLGESGAVLDSGAFLFSPAVIGVQSVDPTAAGDSFIGAYATAACLGLSDADALLFANHTAAITVSRLGAMPSLPTLAEVESHLAAAGHALPLDALKAGGRV